MFILGSDFFGYKMARKIFLIMILIFSKKYDIVYNSYTDVKTYLKSNCNFFSKKMLILRSDFFGYKMARKNFFKNDFNFFKKI